MTKHTRQVSASQTHQFMSVPIPEAALYSQAPTRMSMSGSFLDTTSPVAPTLMQMAPPQHHQQQDPYDLYTDAPAMAPQHSQPGLQPSASFHHRASSGAWSREDDRQLLEARAKGLNWSQVKSKFSNKSANACRKRHERLMERKDADDWDNRKLEQLAKEYMSMRKEIWAPLANRVGEKWNVVEQKCMSNGLKNLQSASRSASRRDRLESSALSGYDDDSGISGIGLTPVDELDPSYSSPGTSPSGSLSSSSGHAGAYGHYPQHPQHQHQHQHHHSHSHGQHLMPHGQMPIPSPAGAGGAGYGGMNAYGNGYGNQHGYSSSVSSNASAGHGFHGAAHGEDQYLRSQRVNGEMGVGSLVSSSSGGRIRR